MDNSYRMLVKSLCTAFLVIGCMSAKGFSQPNCSDVVGSVSLLIDVYTVEYTEYGGLFLNLNETAACGGPVMGWQFCYYLQQKFSKADFNKAPVHVGMWKPLNDNVYQLINESFRLLPITPPNEGVNFLCQQWILPMESRFSIENGSVVGVFSSQTAQTAHVVIKERERARTYFKTGGLNDRYLISVDSLTEISGFALYVEALMGNESFVSSPTPTDVDLPLWAVYTILCLGICIVVLVLLLGVILKLTRSHKRKPKVKLAHIGHFPGSDEERSSQLGTEIQDPNIQHSRFQSSLEFESSQVQHVAAQVMATKPRNHIALTSTPAHLNNQPSREWRSEENVNKHFDHIVIGSSMSGPSQSGQERNHSSKLNRNILQVPTNRPTVLPYHLYKLNLRRSQSEFNILLPSAVKEKQRWSHSEDDLLSSCESDYPYVIHTRDVLGHSANQAQPLPNQLSHVDESSIPPGSHCKKVSRESFDLHFHLQPNLECDSIYSYPYAFTDPPTVRYTMDRNRSMKASKGPSSCYTTQQSKEDNLKRVRKDGYSNKDNASLRKPDVTSPEYVEISEWGVPQTNSSKPGQTDHVPTVKEGLGLDNVSLRKPDVTSPEYLEILEWGIPQTNSSKPEQTDHVIVNDSERESIDVPRPKEDVFMHMSVPDYLPLLQLCKQKISESIYTVPSQVATDEETVCVYDVPPVD